MEKERRELKKKKNALKDAIVVELLLRSGMECVGFLSFGGYFREAEFVVSL